MTTRPALLCSVLLALAATGCERAEPQAPPIGPGAFEGQVWSHPELGLALTLPDGWSVQDEEQKKRLMDVGAETVAAGNKQLSAQLKGGSERTVSLFTVFEHPVASTLDFNPSIFGIAENLRYAPKVETPTDYFGEAKELMRRSAVGIEYPRDPDTQTLGGEPFEVLYARMSTPTGKISQRYFARRFDDYMVLIIASHETEEQAATIDASLATLRFVEPAPAAEGR